ncbi:hypothetical protein BS50DRAFT_217744 [Corynespora cassiicola Philippines]|uniref:Uncharacterized protein n=1 Tax=Corynespora cassiicola Philippines TaxID=1448308 RepID=A0A2T2N3T3_CORCC|nr:hypothetical protein BS50DRAFT_217744 [Corynespora cassiicola Philippines]
MCGTSSPQCLLSVCPVQINGCIPWRLATPLTTSPPLPSSITLPSCKCASRLHVRFPAIASSATKARLAGRGSWHTINQHHHRTRSLSRGLSSLLHRSSRCYYIYVRLPGLLPLLLPSLCQLLTLCYADARPRHIHRPSRLINTRAPTACLTALHI